MIEEDLSRVEESATKSTYRLGVGFERCEKSSPKFVPSSSYHKEEEALKPTKERSKERKPQAKRGSFYLHVLWPCWSLR
jgi:hypothetical protein